jgi:hypothetical protein
LVFPPLAAGFKGVSPSVLFLAYYWDWGQNSYLMYLR